MKILSNRKWLIIFLATYGAFVFLPFMAPVFMHWNLPGMGRAIYLIYSFFCHQLPERSLFLFGPKLMYSMNEIRAVWQNTESPFILRQFIGNPELGWKVAWSDRMISLYTSIWLFAAAWWPFRKKIKPLSVMGFALFLFPLALDGGSHMVSDLAGIGQGFRDTNQWLATLTNNALPSSFLVGDLLGSFNSWARIITGLLAGIGIIWFAFPHLEMSFGED